MTQLDELAERLVARPAAPPPPLHALESRLYERRQRRRRRRQAVAVLLFLAGSGLFLRAAFLRGSDGVELVVSQSTTATTTAEARKWSVTQLRAPEGFAPRAYPAVASDGEVLFVWGGVDAGIAVSSEGGGTARGYTDGILIDVSTGEAAEVAPSPFARGSVRPQALITGDWAVVANGTELAAYNLVTSRWSDVAVLGEPVTGLVELDGTVFALGPEAVLELSGYDVPAEKQRVQTGDVQPTEAAELDGDLYLLGRRAAGAAQWALLKVDDPVGAATATEIEAPILSEGTAQQADLAVSDGKLLVGATEPASGASIAGYDPSSGEWTEPEPLWAASPRERLAMASTPEGVVVVGSTRAAVARGTRPGPEPVDDFAACSPDLAAFAASNGIVVSAGMRESGTELELCVLSETPAAPTPSTTTTTTEPGDPVRMTLPPVEDFIDDPALVEFFRWLPDAGLFERPGPTLLVLVEAGFGSPERLDTSVPGTAAFGIWDGDAALDRFLEEMAEVPGLDGSLTIEDLPQGIVVYPRFPTRPLAELAAPYLAQDGVIGVVPLLDQPPKVSYDAPPGWEELAVVEDDLERADVTVMSGDTLIAWSARGVTAVDPDGTVRTGGPGPLRAGFPCCGAYQAVAVDGEVIILGSGEGTAAAALDVGTLRWRELPDRPVEGVLIGAALRGEELVVVARDDSAPGSDAARYSVLALQLRQETWRQLPQLPPDLTPTGVTSDGDRLIVHGTHTAPEGTSPAGTGARVVEAIDGTWIDLPPPPIGSTASSVIPYGDALLAWNHDLEAARFDGTDWELLPDMPLDPSECQPVADPLTDPVVAHQCGNLVRYRSDTGEWELIDGLDAQWRNWYRVAVGATSAVAIETTAPGETTLFTRPIDR